MTPNDLTFIEPEKLKKYFSSLVTINREAGLNPQDAEDAGHIQSNERPASFEQNNVTEELVRIELYLPVETSRTSGHYN